MKIKYFNWQVYLGLLLILLSVLLYIAHYAVFRDAHHIFVYLLGDIAFLPIEVLLVTMILHSLLTQREKKARLQKLNMVIGVFFSEVGTNVLALFSDFDPQLEEIKKEFIVKSDWTEKEFISVSKRVRNYNYDAASEKIDFENLRTLLLEKRDFLLRLLENPALLEHESFTELLQAIFHLAEELAKRENLSGLPRTDREHLVGDIKRVYNILAAEWFNYMKHLKDFYPYLFSLAMRTNPFDQSASPIVK